MFTKTFKPTAEMISVTETVLLATAYQQTTKACVDAYQREILQTEQLYIDPKYIGRRGEVDRVILEPAEVYMLAQKDLIWVSDLFEWKAKDLGYDIKPGECPAMVADFLLVQAEHALIDVMEPVSGISREQVLGSANALANYRKLIDLNLNFLVRFVRPSKSILATVMPAKFNRYPGV